MVLERHKETAELGGQVLQVGVGSVVDPRPNVRCKKQEKHARSQERNENKDNKVENRKADTGKNRTHIKNA